MLLLPARGNCMSRASGSDSPVPVAPRPVALVHPRPVAPVPSSAPVPSRSSGFPASAGVPSLPPPAPPHSGAPASVSAPARVPVVHAPVPASVKSAGRTAVRGPRKSRPGHDTKIMYFCKDDHVTVMQLTEFINQQTHEISPGSSVPIATCRLPQTCLILDKGKNWKCEVPHELWN